MQIAAGVPLEQIAKRVGHKRYSLTVDTYGHMLPAEDRAAADALDRFVAAQRLDARVSDRNGKH